jgi:putative transposase
MAINLGISTMRYKPHRRDDTAVRKRIKEIVVSRVRYGYERICVLLKREGWPDNHKRIRRIYREEGLNLRNKRPRRNRSAAHRLDRIQLTGLFQCWSMDFVHDQLFNGRKIRTLTIVDNFSRFCYAIAVATSFKAKQVVDVLEDLRINHKVKPERIQVDNESPFASKELDTWAFNNNVTLDFSRKGKPTDNPYIESFNGKYRDECLNVNWFLSLKDAGEKIEQWRIDYNNYRPHSSIEDKTPQEMVNEHSKKPRKL